jgi:hypothetical protein
MTQTAHNKYPHSLAAILSPSTASEDPGGVSPAASPKRTHTEAFAVGAQRNQSTASPTQQRASICTATSPGTRGADDEAGRAMKGGQEEKKPQRMVRSLIACARCRRYDSNLLHLSGTLHDGLMPFIGVRSNVSTKVPIRRARLALQVAGTASTQLQRLFQLLIQDGPRLQRIISKRRVKVRRELGRLRIQEGEIVLGLKTHWRHLYSRGKSGMKSMTFSSCTFPRKSRFFTRQPSEIGCVKLRIQEIIRLHQQIFRMGKFCC